MQAYRGGEPIVSEVCIGGYIYISLRGSVTFCLGWIIHCFIQVFFCLFRYENKQMFCRQGCRCEQQYRLHRLLAYDPSNDCRGIFSDWFKFPSCCVCRCYDLPSELRLTSRSPRFFQDSQEDWDDTNSTRQQHFYKVSIVIFVILQPHCYKSVNQNQGING